MDEGETRGVKLRDMRDGLGRNRLSGRIPCGQIDQAPRSSELYERQEGTDWHRCTVAVRVTRRHTRRLTPALVVFMVSQGECNEHA